MQEERSIMTDTEYNLHKQLAEELAFLWHVGGYIKDAEKDGNKEAADAFRQLKADEEKHARMLREMLSHGK